MTDTCDRSEVKNGNGTEGLHPSPWGLWPGGGHCSRLVRNCCKLLRNCSSLFVFGERRPNPRIPDGRAQAQLIACLLSGNGNMGPSAKVRLGGIAD
jgi:hypothetical protein